MEGEDGEWETAPTMQAAGEGTHRSLRRNHSDWWEGMEKEEGRQIKLKGCLSRDSGKRSSQEPLGSPPSRIPLRDHGHTQSTKY